MLIILIHLMGFSYDWKAHFLESYIHNKQIEYRMGGIGPKYYDCGGVVTEAYRMIGYRGYKLNSQLYHIDPSCTQSIRLSQKGDVLIDKTPGRLHVALITENLGNRIQVLDYVNTFHRSSYRYYGIYPGLVSLDKDCLLKTSKQ